MIYYPELLATVFSTFAGNESPAVIALTASHQQREETPERSSQGRFEFPVSSLPSGCELRSLPNDESFLDQAMSTVAGSNARCAFVFPPFIGEKRLSAHWQERFRWLGIPEVVASTLLGDGEQPGLFDTRPSSSHINVLSMLVPKHFVAAFRSNRWRQEFFPGHSAVVIEHEHDNVPEGLGLPFHSAVQFSTVVFRRQPGSIRFFKITSEALSQGLDRLTSDLERLLRQPAGKTRFGYVYAGPLEENYPCSYDFYSEETEKLRQEIGVLGQRVPLETVADVLLGFRVCSPRQDTDQGETGFLFLGGEAITRDGRVDLSDLKTQPRASQVWHYLQDGDFCIRQMYRSEGFVVGVFEGDGRPVTFSSTVIVVRPRPQLNPAQRQVLLSFLRSPLAHRLANAKQMLASLGDCYRVTPSVLRDFPVPVADEELVTAIQQLNEAKTAFAQWTGHINQESNAILMETTATGSRRRMLEAGRLARQRHRAGQQVEELDYRIRTQFPHPLAYLWRELQVIGPDNYQRLRAVIKAAEGHTCFIALVAILISRILGKPLGSVQQIGQRLAQRKSGTNFGDWFAIVKEVNESRAFQQSHLTCPFAEAMQICNSPDWEGAIRKLMELRNDDSHQRVAPGCVSQSVLSEAEQALETVYRTTDFLTDYQLRYITNTRFDSIRQVNQYEYRDLTGDNPLAPLSSDQAARADLESGSLYLRDRKGSLHLFRPLLHYLECPRCHLLSTFFLDTYDSSADAEAVGLKSFERNSTRVEKVANDFRAIGFLPPLGDAT